MTKNVPAGPCKTCVLETCPGADGCPLLAEEIGQTETPPIGATKQHKLNIPPDVNAVLLRSGQKHPENGWILFEWKPAIKKISLTVHNRDFKKYNEENKIQNERTFFTPGSDCFKKAKLHWRKNILTKVEREVLVKTQRKVLANQDQEPELDQD